MLPKELFPLSTRSPLPQGSRTFYFTWQKIPQSRYPLVLSISPQPSTIACGRSIAKTSSAQLYASASGCGRRVARNASAWLCCPFPCLSRSAWNRRPKMRMSSAPGLCMNRCSCLTLIARTHSLFWRCSCSALAPQRSCAQQRREGSSSQFSAWALPLSNARTPACATPSPRLQSASSMRTATSTCARGRPARETCASR